MGQHLKRQAPDWHAEAAKLLREHHASIGADLASATRRAVWFGLLFVQVKARGKADKSIPHGQFRDWVKENVPDISYTTATFYMTIGQGAAEQAKLSNSKSRSSAFSHDGKLPKEVEEVIAGKNQRQLFLEYRQAKIENDVYIRAAGRRKGEGGNSAEHLAKVREIQEAAARKALVLQSKKFRSWVDEQADDEHWGKRLTDEEAVLLEESLRVALDYLAPLNKARKGGKNGN